MWRVGYRGRREPGSLGISWHRLTKEPHQCVGGRAWRQIRLFEQAGGERALGPRVNKILKSALANFTSKM